MRARLTGIAILVLALCGCERGGATGAQSAAPDSSAALEACPQTSILCREPRLATARDKIKSALDKASAGVSAQGARLLAQNQNEWLESQRVACGVPAGAITLTPDQQSCIEAAFADRLKSAAQAVQKIGPYVFQRVELNAASKAEAGAAPEGAPDTIVQDVAFPRIDGDSPAIRKFNELVAQRPRFSAADTTNETTKYDIAFAGPELISVKFDYYDYSLGAAHPNTDAKAINFNMKTLAPLRAEDVFKPGSGWEKALAKKGAAGVTKVLKEFDDSLPPTAPDQILSAISSPGKWAITDKALVLLLSEEDMGSHAIGGHEIAIPWSELKAYLNPAAPSPIRAT